MTYQEIITRIHNKFKRIQVIQTIRFNNFTNPVVYSWSLIGTIETFHACLNDIRKVNIVGMDSYDVPRDYHLHP